MEEAAPSLPRGFSLQSGSLSLRGTSKDDCVLIRAPEGARVSAVFTRNLFCGAPVTWNKTQISRSGGVMRALLVNTVFANAGTGSAGLKSSAEIAHWLAQTLAVDPTEVLLASTGKIGPQLPVERFVAGLPQILSAAEDDIERASRAMLTTDLVPKLECRRLQSGALVLGIAKGSGMIAPDMATMLAFVLTDAVIGKEKLDRDWSRITADSFNQVNVDGCQSTSDMALVMSSGLVASDEEELLSALKEVATGLAKKIAADGEGASHLIEVTARHVKNAADARALAKAVVSSHLFKAAVCGHDPNWGRIASAIGSCGVGFDPALLSISIDDEPVFARGEPIALPDAQKMFRQREVRVELDFNDGQAEARAWGCDLTKRYVEINAEYST